MENLDLIFKRGSIRKFLTDKMVEEDKIRIILDAGFAAPSACNMRPYHFMVIDDRHIIEEIAKTGQGKRVGLLAPQLIAVLGDLNIQDHYEFVLNDTSACIQNMLLAIHGLGLGGCWLGQKRTVDNIVNELLGLPRNIFVAGFIAVGYPDQEKTQPNRYDESKVHHNKW